MNAGLRKFVVGFLALGGLLGIYLLYLRFNRTSPVVITSARELLPAPAAEANGGDPGIETGTIAGVDVGPIEQTRFLHRNEHKEVDREFGFERFQRAEGDQWVITSPYMKLFLPGFSCHVTARRGRVQLETAFGRPMPSDATFSGNVVIHIIPADPNAPWESFIYLDDVEFLAEKSLFTTPGPVRFLSRNARLTGAGMELLYDQPRNRLELFRIFELDSLRLRSSVFGSIAGLPSGPSDPGEAARSAGAGQEQTGRDPGLPAQRYQCLVRRNVIIDTPDRTVVARDLLAINNILWSQAGDSDAATVRSSPGTEQETNPPDEPRAATQAAASSLPPLDSIPEQLFDVVIRCDGGFAITPVGSSRQPAEAVESGASQESPAETAIAPGRQYATAQRIDFDASSTDTTLAGPVEMMFLLDPNGLIGGHAARESGGSDVGIPGVPRPAQPSPGKPVPMMVTAQEAVRFLAASNQVVLEGDCTVALHRPELNLTYEYGLTAPRLTLDLVRDANAPGAAAASIRKLVADGGPVTLRILRRDPDKLLGWTRLESPQVRYDADRGEFTALGPGVVTIHNAEAADPKADPNQPGLGRPCYAFLRNFDTLTYSVSANRIVAEEDTRQLLLDYFPLIEGRHDRHIRIVAGHIEVFLKEVAAGRLELASLTASKGIRYEDQTSRFIGSILTYDHSRALVTVTGDDELPCYFNGALVDRIEANLKTGRIEAPISAPSILQVRR